MKMQTPTPFSQAVTLDHLGCSATQPDQAADVRAGSLCPRCGEGRLDYDGLLTLTCPVCFWTLGGGSFT